MINFYSINKALLLIALLFVNISCIDLYNPVLDVTDAESILVVEGKITDEIGPFRVKLSKSVPVDVMAFSDPESGADVYIYDDKGNNYSLFEQNDGWYETEDKNLKGIVGNVYTLSITTIDGKQYESVPEKMLDVPPIDSVYFREVQKTSFENNLPVDKTWVEILLDTKADGDGNNFFRWGFTETWQVEMLTTNREVIFGEGENRYTSRENITIDDQKKRCWVSNSFNSILISSTEKLSDKKLNKVVINSISPQNERVFIKYSILVKQYSLSKKLYHYFKELKATNEGTGGIYEKNPALLNGNLQCCDSDGKVLGYFSASAVKSKRLFIYPYDVNVEKRSAFNACMYHSPKPRHIISFLFGYTDGNAPVYSTNNICADCRYYGTNIKPDFWE